MLSPKICNKRSKISKKLKFMLRNLLSGGANAGAETLVGIDFGSRHIYALVLRYLPATMTQAARYQLHAMASVPTPSGAILDHQLQPIPQLVQALRQLRRLLKVRSRQVASAVSGSSVTTKILQVPARLPAELLDYHVQQAAVQLRLPLAELSLDFEVLKADASQPDRDRVLLSAARTEQVQARVSALRQAGWRAQVIDIASHALARAACFLLAPAAAELVAVLELDAESLTFMVIGEGEIIYQRLQPLAAYAEGADLSHAHDLESISLQVQRQLQLFCSNSGSGAPHTWLLCGSADPLPPLAAYLSEILGLRVQLPDFSRILGDDADLHPQAAAFSTALGLALRHAVSCRI